MSLQLLAKQMEAKGRGGDSMLVHMTAGEVAGLQKLAEAAGGSLSVNPETGLVEANFLKRMLPTLVGLGVGMVGGPVAGAAAGAAVGGYQARRNDQDVLLGAAMGGLGGYGGASMGAGLSAAGSQAAQAGAMQTAMNTAAANPATAANVANVGATTMPSGFIGAGADGIAGEQLAALSQQTANETLRQEATARAIEQAAEKAGTDFAAQGLRDRAGQGISALMDQGSNVGREAFMSKVGGGAGLISDVGMAATPLMAPGKMEAPEEIPVDDEMYYTEYNPGQTGQRSSTSTEVPQFSGGYAPMEKIKASEYADRRNRRYAAEGGLMSLAEGGDVTDAADAGIAGGMSGASKAAFDYLMGRSASSSGQQTAAPAQTTMTAPAQASARSDREYIFNPATGAFSRNPNFVVAAAPVKSVGRFANFGSFGRKDDDSGARDGTPMTQAQIDAFDNETPAERDARMEKVGKVLGALVPGGMAFKALKSIFTPAPQATANGGESVNSPGLSMGSNPDGSGNAAGANAATAAQGGLMSLAKGGMKSGGFVVPADVVSMIGEGNTDAGYSRIKSMIPGATAIKGKDGGQADTVKTSIEGKQPARVAHGEMYIPPETVKRMGGAKKLYAMMDRVREQATGSKKQIKPVSLKRAMA
jgi:hypothetical protein